MRISDKPWVKRAILCAAGALLLYLTVLPVQYVFGQLENKEKSSLANLEKPPIPDAENAARWIEVGAEAILWTDEETQFIGPATFLPYDEWSPELREQVSEVLATHHGALLTLHKAVSVTRSSYELRYRDGFAMEMPDLLRIVQASRLLLCEARASFGADDPQNGLLALATMFRISTSLANEDTLITALLSIAIERMALRPALETTEMKAPWADQEFFQALEQLPPQHTSEELIQRVAKAWEAVVIDAIKRGSQLPSASVYASDSREIPQGFTAKDAAEVVALITELTSRSFGSSKEQFTKLINPTTDDGIAVDLKGFANAISRFQAAEAMRQLLTAAVQMRILGGEVGHYPEERPAIPELKQPDRFTGRLISYHRAADDTLTLALQGAPELIEICAPLAVHSMAPITLPAPESQ